ncbi:MAG: hypothetical protein HOW71_26575 [Nonomuraea sp.]|nr:hypothetical protein [Nonomuraea sp.]
MPGEDRQQGEPDEFRVECTPQDASGGGLIACYGGLGHAWMDGRWADFPPGAVLPAPPGVPHSYQAIRGGDWRLCRVVRTATGRPSTCLSHGRCRASLAR